MTYEHYNGKFAAGIWDDYPNFAKFAVYYFLSFSL